MTTVASVGVMVLIDKGERGNETIGRVDKEHRKPSEGISLQRTKC
jgi:hypothetical protein